MKEKVLENKKGITLIALVITIIVMLILVAVTITIAVNGGLFGYAGKAAKDTENAKQEEEKIGKGQIIINGKEYYSLYEYINAESFSEIYTTTKEYTDSNGEKAIIPKGFARGKSEGINKVQDGLVIQDDKGNQFVWIPVDYTKTNIDENNNGLDDGFEEVFCRSLWSNNARTTGLSNYYIENATNDPTEKYMEMMLSVQNHKGFYIGRYESGIPTTENPRTTIEADLGNSTLVIQRDAYPYICVGWGKTMTDYTNDITNTSGGSTYNLGKGAVYLSRNMYSSSNDNYGAVSTLCYGVQWDAMLDFIKDTEHNVTNSVTWGNYNYSNWTINRQTAKYSEDNGVTWKNISDEPEKKKEKSLGSTILLTTGASDAFKAKNIYDIAGNTWEWTMERYISERETRGGCYYNNAGSGHPASFRYPYAPDSKGCTLSFRVALYL